MQAHYPEAFDRDVGSTEAEWLAQLPGAANGNAVEIGSGAARIAVGAGELLLAWQVLPPRRIALIELPRLAVRFRFEGVGDEARHAFMRYFDRYMQRGGG